jgi:hypothetical protein
MKPTARVTATYELNAQAAPQMEQILREGVPPQISCTVIEVKTVVDQPEEVAHAEQVSREPDGEREVLGGAAEKPKRKRAKRVNAGENRCVAGPARKSAAKK